MNDLFKTLKMTILALVITIGANYLYAWTGPTAPPPDNGGVTEPINEGTKDQIKQGGIHTNKALSAGGLFRAFQNAQFDADIDVTGRASFGGNVSIGGDVSTTGVIKLAGGTVGCDSTNAGAIKFDGVDFYGCNGTSWSIFQANAPSLSGNNHTETECLGAGGTIQSNGGENYCKFDSRASCPVGWSQYQNFTTTAPAQCNPYNYWEGGLCQDFSILSCTTGSHAYGNTAIETCTYYLDNPKDRRYFDANSLCQGSNLRWFGNWCSQMKATTYTSVLDMDGYTFIPRPGSPEKYYCTSRPSYRRACYATRVNGIGCY